METTEQHKTIFYGIGKTSKELGPTAWEKRIDDVIKNKILPKSSQKMKAWIEQNHGWIAKAGGWVATGVEVGVVAAVIYGGVKGIKKFRKEPRPFPSPPDLSKTEAVSIARNLQTTPMIGVTPKWWRQASAQEQKSTKEWVDPTLRELGEAVRARQKAHDEVARRIRGARHRWVMGAKHRPPITVTADDIPVWLHELADPYRKAKVVQRIISETPSRIRSIIDQVEGNPNVVVRRAEIAERVRLLAGVDDWTMPVVERLHQQVRDKNPNLVGLLETLRRMPEQTMPQKVEKAKIAARLFKLVRGLKNTKENVYQHAIDWILRGMPGLEYILRT